MSGSGLTWCVQACAVMASGAVSLMGGSGAPQVAALVSLDGDISPTPEWILGQVNSVVVTLCDGRVHHLSRETVEAELSRAQGGACSPVMTPALSPPALGGYSARLAGAGPSSGQISGSRKRDASSCGAVRSVTRKMWREWA